MKERPILFSGEMMRAILDGRKGQTRRIIKPQPPPETVGYSWCISTDKKRDGRFIPRRSNGPRCNHHQYECGPPVRCPYGVPGDRLWCRETWAVELKYDSCRPLDIRTYPRMPVWFRTGDLVRDKRLVSIWDRRLGLGLLAGRWRPGIHMPRWASRVTLEVTEVRAERLHDITADDIIAEGFERDDPRISDVTLRSRLANAWDGINSKRVPWSANPWVWVVAFSVSSPSSRVSCT